jgi:hypothetical protein
MRAENLLRLARDTVDTGADLPDDGSLLIAFRL